MEKIKYEFGVMSNRWGLESEEEDIAYITISLFIKKNIPVAVYLPKSDGFMPISVLEKNKDSFDPQKV